MKNKKEDLRKALCLYAITDKTWLNGRTLYEQVEEALQGGVTMLQFRDKQGSKRGLFTEAMALKQLCARYQVPFIINDDVALAKEVDADGVHVGQQDMEAAKAREFLGPDKIIGVSARTPEQALAAQEQGADYLGTGAVFATGTKKDASVIGVARLKEVCESVTIPVVAIGGITKDHLAVFSGSGISGVAVVSAVFAQPDIVSAVKELKQKVLLCAMGMEGK